MITMSIFRPNESRVLSALFKIAAWAVVILFGLTIAAIADLVLTLAGWSR